MANSILDIPKRYATNTTRIGFWHRTATAAELYAGVVVVPPVRGKQFVALQTGIKALGGTCNNCTTVRLSETTSNGVVHSQVAADMTVVAGWRIASVAGGTCVTTKLSVPLVISEGIKLYSVGGTANTAMTSCEVLISGFYISDTTV